MTNATESPRAESAEDEERDDAHLEDVDVGAGCTEIWEHLAERRGEARDDRRT